MPQSVNLKSLVFVFVWEINSPATVGFSLHGQFFFFFSIHLFRLSHRQARGLARVSKFHASRRHRGIKSIARCKVSAKHETFIERSDKARHRTSQMTESFPYHCLHLLEQ